MGLYVGTSRAESPAFWVNSWQARPYTPILWCALPRSAEVRAPSVLPGSSSRMTQFHVWWVEGHSYLPMQCVTLQPFPGA